VNDQGELWIPGLINTMGNMTPGEGYMVMTNENVTLTYDVPVGYAIHLGYDAESLPEIESEPYPTGLPYPILVYCSNELRAWHPASIEVWDGDLLVGRSLISDDGPTAVIAWQGSASHGLPGFTPGDPVLIDLLAADGSSISVDVSESTAFFGQNPYLTLHLMLGSLPVEFSVSNGYPNPFNSTLTVPFALPKAGTVSFSLYNILGQQVFQVKEVFNAGRHRYLLDSSPLQHDLVSGMYILQVQFTEQRFQQKVMLLK